MARVSTLACLRATGMPLDGMRRYFTLAARRHLDYVHRKIDYWAALEAGKDAEARRIADELVQRT